MFTWIEAIAFVEIRKVSLLIFKIESQRGYSSINEIDRVDQLWIRLQPLLSQWICSPPSHLTLKIEI